jgi:hypothetical protein
LIVADIQRSLVVEEVRDDLRAYHVPVEHEYEYWRLFWKAGSLVILHQEPPDDVLVVAQSTIRGLAGYLVQLSYEVSFDLEQLEEKDRLSGCFHRCSAVY